MKSLVLSEERDSAMVHLEGISHLDEKVDLAVKIENTESPMSHSLNEEFVRLSAKAISLYSNRFDHVLKRNGPQDFYDEYLTWREMTLAVQEAKQAAAEVEKLEEALINLRKEQAEILEWAEREGGPEARLNLEKSVMMKRNPE